MYWTCLGIAIFKEIGGVIYKNDKGYYWDDVKIGQDKEIVWDIPKVKKGVAFIHTHSGGEHWNTKSMSNADFKSAKDLGRPLYMVDSGGQLWVYNPKEDKPKQKLVCEGTPKDARWLDIEHSSQQHSEYFKKGYWCLDEYEYGYKADYFNKLHINNQSYLKEC